MFQFRPTDPANNVGAMYGPHRDVANMGGNMIRAAVHSLDREHWEPHIREWLDDQGVTVEAILPVAEKFTAAMVTLFDYESLYEALEAQGFFVEDPLIQTFIFSRLGQVLLVFYWESMREKSARGTKPPLELVEMAERLYRELENFRNAHKR